MVGINDRYGNIAGRVWRLGAAAALFVATVGAPASATATVSKPGGLVSLPGATSGWTDFVKNGGFEEPTAADALHPTGWSPSPASAWKRDIGRTGGFSYRFANASGPEASQEHFLEPGTYKLSGWMRTQGKSSTGTARLRIDFRPGGINDWKHTREIGGTTDWTLYELTVAVPSAYADPATGLVRAHVMLDGYWARPGLSAWYDDVKLERQNVLPLDVFMHHPNYRGTLFAAPAKQDLTFRVVVKHAGALAAPQDYEVVSRVTRETDLAEVETLRHPLVGGSAALQTDPETGDKYLVVSANQPVAGVRPVTDDGGYLVTFALTKGGADLPGLLEFPPYRVNKVSARLGLEAGRIAFNADNQVMIDGAPRFVLGAYDAGINYTDDPAIWESTLWAPNGERRMSGLRINMYLNYHFGDAPAAAMNALMTNLSSHGVVYLQTGNCFSNFPASQHVGPDNTGFEIDVATPDYIVNGIAPAVAGYYVADECAANLVPEVFKQYKDGLVRPNTGLQVLDPDSMTFAALFGNKDLLLWRDAVDVLSTDPYPLFGSEPAGGYPHGQVADWTKLARQAVQDARPFFTVLQFFKFDNGRRQGRWPTYQEMRNHAYMAIAEGARGLFWWSLGENGLANACRSGGWCVERTTYMENLKRLVSELADSERELLAPDAPGVLSVSNAAVKTKVKLLDGVGYIVAYNSTNTDNVSASFTWALPASTLTVNGQPPVALPANGTFTDTFAKYEARVYRIHP